MRGLVNLAWVELKLLIREPLTLVFSFGFPVLVLFVLAEVFGSHNQDRSNYRGVEAIDYYVPAYVALVIASIGLISLPVHLAAYRERGILRRLRASGLSVWRLLGAQVFVCFMLAIVGAVLISALGEFVYDAHRPRSYLGVTAMFFLVTLMFAAIGVLLSALSPSARAAQGVGLSLFFLMMFVSGAGPPPGSMSTTLRRIGEVMPLTPAIRAIQNPWLGFDWSAYQLILSGGFLVGATALAVGLFRWQ